MVPAPSPRSECVERTLGPALHLVSCQCSLMCWGCLSLHPLWGETVGPFILYQGCQRVSVPPDEDS